MRAIGFMQGQFGDLILSTVAARAHKIKYPDSRLTLGLNKRFEAILPLFGAHVSFDDYHIYQEYSNWPGGEDNLFLAKNQFDIVYHAMPTRANEATWWKTEHQAANVCSVYDLIPPPNLQCDLTKWFDVPDNSEYVAFQPFGGFPDWPNKKSFSIERANQIVYLIKTAGYKVLQIGGPGEPLLEGAEKKDLSYFESVKNMLGCRAFVTVDTGLNWVASAYSMPTLGLYSNQYYGREFIKAIQPVNPNAIYLDEVTVNDITLDAVLLSLKELLK
jgi:ADP-heptose:LPS heptosyltransferase